MSVEFETEYNAYINQQKSLKENTALEAKKVTRKLSPSDVKLLKAFLGYSKIKQIENSPVRNTEDAPIYVVECLFNLKCQFTYFEHEFISR